MTAARRQTTPLQMDGAPHSIEAEQALLGAILINNEALNVVGKLAPAHFFDPLHQEIFRACQASAGDGKRFSPRTLAPHFRDISVGEMTGAQYLGALVAEATTVINAPDFAAVIMDTATQRAIIAFSQQLEQTARAPDGGSSAEQLLDVAEANLGALRLADGRADIEDHSIGAVMKRLADNAHAVAAGSAQPIPSSGLTDLDFALGGGLRPGRLIIMAGRPGMGKTQLAMAINRRVAKSEVVTFLLASTSLQTTIKWGSAFFSLEIDDAEMGARTLAADLAASIMPGLTPPSYGEILAGRLDENGRDMVERGAARFAEVPSELICRSDLTAAAIVARIKLIQAQMAAKGITLGVVFIDYLQLITPSDRYTGNMVNELGETVLTLKKGARRLGVCIVLLSQLTRDVEKRDDKRPTMGDLRGSGNIEEHADAVGLIYRHAYYDQKHPKYRSGDPDFVAIADARANDMDLDWGKNRLGPSIMNTFHCVIGTGLINDKRGFGR